MQTMRYINLLDKTSNVKTKNCFFYNNAIFFAVPRQFVSRAIGPDASNVKKIQEYLGKKIKIIREPNGLGDISEFIGNIVAPARFKSVEVKDNVVVITAGNNQNKAILIGRNKRRLLELEKIIIEIFHINLKII